MSLGLILLYGIVQGVSEFLPISSSAHLTLVARFFSVAPPTPTIEAAVHCGSLLALCVYFWRDILKLFQGGIDILRGHQNTEARNLFVNLVFATLPVLFCGFVLYITVGRGPFNTLEIMAWTTTVFGFLLLVADKLFERRSLSQLTRPQAFLGWGLAQCLAFVHGVSRSGICITAGRVMGFRRYDAVLFSFLMALPSLAGAVFLLGRSWLKTPTVLADSLSGGAVSVAVFSSFVVGLLTIRVLIKGLTTGFLQGIALYRVGLGLLLLFGCYVRGWS